MSAPGSLGAPVPADDRGFLYGDGVFETIAVRGGVPLWIERHLDRLQRGLARLAIAQAVEPLRRAVSQQAQHLSGHGVLRLTVTRGSAARGYRPQQGAAARFRIQVSALDHDPLLPVPAQRLASADIRLAVQPQLAGIKHLNRLEQVLAAAEAGQRGVDDVLLRSSDGDLYGGSRSNLFLQQGELLRTPPCDRVGVAGTRRQLVIEELAARVGLRVEVGRLELPDLWRSDGVFVCNSVMGLCGVAELDDRVLPPAPALEALQEAYQEAGRRCAAPC